MMSALTNKYVMCFFMLVALTLFKAIYPLGYASAVATITKITLYPVMVSCMLLFYSSKYFLWGLRRTILVFFAFVLLAEALEHLIYFLRTGVHFLNDFEAGSVGMGVIIVHTVIGIIILSSNKHKFKPPLS